MASLYEIPIEQIKGVGVKRGELFRKLGVRSVGGLLHFYPRTYEDWSNPTKIIDTQDAQTCCIKATLAGPVTDSFVKGNVQRISKVIVYDDSAAAQLTFFNNKYISSMLKTDTEYFFYGKITKNIYGVQMTSPMFSPVSKGASFRPVYNLTYGLSNKIIMQTVENALKMLPKTIKDPIPAKMQKKYGVCDLRFAIENIHFPKNSKDLEKARKRLIFEELLVLSLGLRGLKNQKKEESKIKTTKDYSKEFEELLPFNLTNAQKRVVKECLNDVKNKKSPMNRLVQGDVGSGKTAVAASVCYTLIKNGYQCAFMVPTEILAGQHYNTLLSLLENTGITVELLTGSLTASQKKKIRARLENGEIDLIIGTHTLITDSTVFKNLGLAVTDEQHRFGVAQRSKLLNKGIVSPHLLVMSATPIPRTLGLIIYGDLDISIIDELPPGRIPVQTLLIDSSKRHRAYNFIKKHIDNSNQCYIVCPLVEEGELDLASAENYAAELMLDEFANYSVGILHGKMKQSDKEKVMSDFVHGQISLLVATTVIEVGVDIPNATIMMIENAERFGLSQLHQLRGRVGRGQAKAYCILLSDNKNEETAARLQIMCKTSNGFKISEEDLKLRGPGDFFGNRQHGLPTLAIADLTDMDNLELSQKAAEEIISFSPDLSHESLRGIKAEIRMLFAKGGKMLN